MHRLILPALLGLTLFVSCSSNPDPEPLPPVNEYLVVGNDRGFRDDFINQANHITAREGSLRVRSLRNADTYFDYPVIDGYVHGGQDPALHWRMDTIGTDSLGLVDTSRNSTFYLHRLNRVDTLPNALGILTSGELHRGDSDNFRTTDNLVYTDMGEGAGCRFSRSYRAYRDWNALRGIAGSDSLPPILYYTPFESPYTIWRLYTRFAQPVLVESVGTDGLRVRLLDSVSTNRDTLYGRSINERSFRFITGWNVVRADGNEVAEDDLFRQLSPAPVRQAILPKDLDTPYRRRWDSDEPDEDYTSVFAREVEGLQLAFGNNGRLLLSSGERELVSREYRRHPTAPYLMVSDDDCDGNFYWHYEQHGDSLTVRVPLRVELPELAENATTMKVNGKDIPVPPSRWYFQGEWTATFLIGDPPGVGESGSLSAGK